MFLGVLLDVGEVEVEFGEVRGFEGGGNFHDEMKGEPSVDQRFELFLLD
jgi:hypothetical protein